ncbi:MAG: hypothetical protein KC652_15190 [Cyanobacteria bacterium HKST-UBA01]|nr:hypothetical protein [Cyanobacteria bacterium HKST-UBA01]
MDELIERFRTVEALIQEFENTGEEMARMWLAQGNPSDPTMTEREFVERFLMGDENPDSPADNPDNPDFWDNQDQNDLRGLSLFQDAFQGFIRVMNEG